MYTGNKLVAGAHQRAFPIESGTNSNYLGTAVINGVKRPVMRGPFYDTFYELSNIFKFDLELKQSYAISKNKAGVLSGDIDFVPFFPSGWFETYQTFQIGR